VEDVLRGFCGRLLGESERADVEFDQSGESALEVARRAERVYVQHFVGIVAVGSVVESLRLPAAWLRSRPRSHQEPPSAVRANRGRGMAPSSARTAVG
jgi:hypothetical protein